MKVAYCKKTIKHTYIGEARGFNTEHSSIWVSLSTKLEERKLAI